MSGQPPLPPHALIQQNPSAFQPPPRFRSMNHSSHPQLSQHRPLIRPRPQQMNHAFPTAGVPGAKDGPVGELNSYVQKNGLLLTYDEWKQNNSIFCCAAIIDHHKYPPGSGSSKKEARKHASFIALTQLMPPAAPRPPSYALPQHRPSSLQFHNFDQDFPRLEHGAGKGQKQCSNKKKKDLAQRTNIPSADVVLESSLCNIPSSSSNSDTSSDISSIPVTNDGTLRHYNDAKPSVNDSMNDYVSPQDVRYVQSGSSAVQQANSTSLVKSEHPTGPLQNVDNNDVTNSSKNPSSSLNEYCQVKRWTLTFNYTSNAHSSQTGFQCSAVINGTSFPPGHGASKQAAKTQASAIALHQLYGCQQNQQRSPSPVYDLQSEDSSMDFDDSISSSEQCTPTSLSIIGFASGATAPPQAAYSSKNPVSELHEFCQAQKLSVEYVQLSESGPPHQKCFTYAVTIGGKQYPAATGSKIKDARTIAARNALQELKYRGHCGSDHTVQARSSMPDFTKGALTSETFKILNKNPISTLQEFAQQRGYSLEYVQVSDSGPDHCRTFECAVKLNDHTFPSVSANKIKDAKTKAAQIALQTLQSNGWIQSEQQHTMGDHMDDIPAEQMTFFDKIASKSHAQYNEVVSKLETPLTGRKIVATILIQVQDEEPIVVSLAQGNRFVKGDLLSQSGETVIDSHAEILARRGLIRYLYSNLLTHEPGSVKSIFKQSVASDGLFSLKAGIRFHLYISMAPCGDGAIFSPRDESDSPEDNAREEHQPLMDKPTYGLLRSKMECGEGTIPVEDSGVQTWDGVLRGARLRTMSCSDKICRWNCLGLQGALLAQFIEPVYLSSLTLGSLYNHGHLSRAVCCRLAVDITNGDNDLDYHLTGDYKVNHPMLGRVTICESQRDTQKSSAQSINWCMDDAMCELTDGTTGRTLDGGASQLCKQQMFDKYKDLCYKYKGTEVKPLMMYRDCKRLSTTYNESKARMYHLLSCNNAGSWVHMPAEVDMFTLKET